MKCHVVQNLKAQNPSCVLSLFKSAKNNNMRTNPQNGFCAIYKLCSWKVVSINNFA